MQSSDFSHYKTQPQIIWDRATKAVLNLQNIKALLQIIKMKSLVISERPATKQASMYSFLKVKIRMLGICTIGTFIDIMTNFKGMIYFMGKITNQWNRISVSMNIKIFYFYDKYNCTVCQILSLSHQWWCSFCNSLNRNGPFLIPHIRPSYSLKCYGTTASLSTQ